ncbi:isocitrate lyase/PEP mutase family protein [Cellulomonas sp. ICMP 17802]|uniref:isocitrate lyase/PEP mutase family protein n=1 Tax=Cellulomonas sp. ICMP 17802 TaxID=3239199 RepID=UPI00351BD75D
MVASAFRALHDGSGPLLLPNAWDVGSALAFVDAGFPAVGTTSFGVGAAAGKPDGDRASRDATRELVRRLAHLPVPVSADVEDGYDDDPEVVAAFVADLPVAGINLEDSTDGRLVEPARHAAKVAAVAHAAPDLFVNARVDTYWFGQDATVRATVDRALTYVDAGAAGIFVPVVGGVLAPADLRVLAREIPVPLNVLVVPGLSLTELGELGVRRVSTGSLPYRAAVDAAVSVATAVRDGRPAPAATSYADMQERLRRHDA